jgi:hypothetical protein
MNKLRQVLPFTLVNRPFLYCSSPRFILARNSGLYFFSSFCMAKGTSKAFKNSIIAFFFIVSAA